MDTSQLLKEAWEAVEKSGVPESLQAVAFREAVEHLQAASDPERGRTQAGDEGRGGKVSSPKKEEEEEKEEGGTAPVDEATFFAQLSDESGADEKDIRDVLSLSGRTVHVTQPTRNLGSNRAEQARTTIALVAGARRFGLGGRPVDADAVRDELKRKNCFDQANFSAKHLGALDGFNPGANRRQIVTTSKWEGEFREAVDQALGRGGDESGN